MRNSIFLLNIPPNREGKFSDQDVQVLKETGKRIKETYGIDLLTDAAAPKELLDTDDDTYLVLQGQQPVVEVSLPTETKINRFLVQEDVRRHGERVSEHALDAWIDGKWKEVATSTNIGYKRILRFPEVVTNKLRLRLLEYRYVPVLQHISAHYYESRPPVLQLERNIEGKVSIVPKMSDFGWNPNGENASANLTKGMQIYYTTDGSEPTKKSNVYEEPFEFSAGEVKSISEMNGEMGSVASKQFGIMKNNWKVVGVDSAQKEHGSDLLKDEDDATYWQSEAKKTGKHFVSIDLGSVLNISGFGYTPPTSMKNGMIQHGGVYASTDGSNWVKIEDFTFGNLINDPTLRIHTFNEVLATRYIKFEATEIAGSGTTAAIAELDIYSE